jgi:RND family efflux transporter MFP subunit
LGRNQGRAPPRKITDQIMRLILRQHRDHVFYHLRRAVALAGLALLGAIAAGPALADRHGTASGAFPGRIEALNRADVSNAIASIVSEIHFKPGQIVRAGDRLFTLDPTDFELAVETERANVLRAEATLKSARQDFERLSTLKSRGSVSKVQVLKSEVALAFGEAVIAQSKAKLMAAEIDLSRSVIRAPISGVISPATVSIGTYVKTGRAPLASIVQLDPVRLAFEVPYIERIELLGLDDLRFPESLLNRVLLSIIISDTWVYSQTTRPDNVAGEVDAVSGTLTIWAELANPNGLLRPGMRVQVRPRVRTR